MQLFGRLMAFNLSGGLCVSVLGFFAANRQTQPVICLFIAIFCGSVAPLAHAATYTQDLNDFISLQVKPLADSDIVIDSLNQANEKHEGISELNLVALDDIWRSELRKITQPLISKIIVNDLSKFLVKMVEGGQGVYTQITVIDIKGLNIGQTVISQNYWNVGKPRWDRIFTVNSSLPYISDVYFSDETNKFQVEVSFMVISDEKPIGIVAAGIDVEQLEGWKKRRK
jgi:hypothetical protein